MLITYQTFSHSRIQIGGTELLVFRDGSVLLIDDQGRGDFLPHPHSEYQTRQEELQGVSEDSSSDNDNDNDDDDDDDDRTNPDVIILDDDDDDNDNPNAVETICLDESCKGEEDNDVIIINVEEALGNRLESPQSPQGFEAFSIDSLPPPSDVKPMDI